MGIFAEHKKFAKNDLPAVMASIPARVPRHSLVARAFHWIMAISMLVLLFTAFLPKVGVQFNWVLYHWIAGIVLTLSILFHIVHASFFLDFWSIWPDKIDMRDAMRRIMRFFGKPAPPPDRFAKYPLENKLYHGVIVLTGLAVIVTGVFMMKRVETIVFTRNPYLFSDMTWGMMYVLHGLAGVGLIALVMVHVYFGIRPEKLAITKSHGLRLHGQGLLSRGTRSRALGCRRDLVHCHRNPRLGGGRGHRTHGRMPQTMLSDIQERCNTIEECYEFTLSYAAQGLSSDVGSESGKQIREQLGLAVKR